MRGKRGQVQIDLPRDRNSEFQPQLVKKNQTRFDGLDEKIISLYSRGMTQREIQGHLEEIYGVEVSPSLISTVTDAVLDEVRAWQSRPLDAVYATLYLYALQVKVKTQGRVTNKAIYLAFGVNLQGLKEVLGMWASDAEGARFWLSVVTELKNRGVGDIFIACVDGLKGFPEAIESGYPQTQVQLCIVHMVRHSLSYVSHRDRKQVAADLKAIYQAATLTEAEHQLNEFEQTWRRIYPVIVKSWRANWSRIVPMFGYPGEIRRAVYYAHIVLFAFCFVITSAQFQEFNWPAFAWTALITIVMGGLVEAAQGVTGKGHCRLRDLIPDTSGALFGAGIVLLLRKIGWRPNPGWSLIKWRGRAPNG